MDVATGLSNIERSLRTIIENARRSELNNRWVQTGLRTTGQLRNVLPQELAAKLEAVRQHERAARAQVISAITQLATNHGLELKVPAGSAGDAQVAATARAAATNAEIRAWAREQHMAVGDRGIISKRIIEAYGQAHASGRGL